MNRLCVHTVSFSVRDWIQSPVDTEGHWLLAVHDGVLYDGL